MTDAQKKDNDELLATFKAITKGNMPAIKFLFLWFYYCHEIDDVLDTMEDGRPVLSKEKILRTYARAFELYNDAFYVENQRTLYPVVVMITNNYADSVQWERDPVEYRRVIADVLCEAGNEMMNMVACVIGGYEWMRHWSPRIREISWTRQHDSTGRHI